jgi:hypothetical protein
MDKLYDTPIKAIRKKCLDCTCGQVLEIRECPVIECPLYPYRMGRRPDKATQIPSRDIMKTNRQYTG